MTEEDLWQAWQAGDEAAFDRLYALVSPSLYTLCRALTRGTAVPADDLYQETFRRALGGAFHPEGTLRAWLATIARNALVDLLRRQPFAILRKSEPVVPSDSVEVLDLLGTLAPEGREVLSLRFLQGLTVEETAGVLGLSAPTVKRRTAEALKDLAGKSGKG